jgi:hypothetical protein
MTHLSGILELFRSAWRLGFGIPLGVRGLLLVLLGFRT